MAERVRVALGLEDVRDLKLGSGKTIPPTWRIDTGQGEIAGPNATVSAKTQRGKPVAQAKPAATPKPATKNAVKKRAAKKPAQASDAKRKATRR